MSKILVVDDEPAIRQALELILFAAGHEVVTAENGVVALDKIISAAEDCESYELLLTDVQMPLKNGTELIREVVRDYPELSVIAMTGYGDRETVVSLMKAGCREFVDKPFTDDEVIAVIDKMVSERSKREERMVRLISEKDRESEKLVHLFTELKKQVDGAVHSHGELISVDASIIPLDFSYKVRPLTDIGGDLLAVEERQDGTVAILIADVAGHDLSASYHTVLMKTLFTKYCEGIDAPITFFKSVNDVLVSAGNERMITAQLVIVDSENEKITVASAGHPPAIYWSSSKHKIEFVELFGDVIGILPDAKFYEESLDYVDGDEILMYTDGIVELKRTDGPTGHSLMLAPQGLSDLFKNYVTLPIDEQVEAIWEDAQEFSRYKIKDDLMMIGIMLNRGVKNV